MSSLLASGHTGLVITVLTLLLWFWLDSLLVALVVGGPLGWLWLRTWVEGPVCKSTRRLEGKVAVVTGANAGIGLYTAKDLAARGAKVILACRDTKKGEDAVKWMKEQTGGLAKVEFRHLDLASFKSVREFASGLAARETKLDILVNNAGIAFTEKTITADGNELLFQTNHLANFLLTNLLLDLLKAAGKSRVVTVSSLAHGWAKDGIQFDDLKWEKKSWSSMEAYNQSKLANIYFMRELAEKTRGSGISTYSLHPGVVGTDIGRNLKDKIPSFLVPLTEKAKLFMKNMESGAQTSIYCCVEESIQEHSGRYYSDCAEKKIATVALDAKASSQLWTVSTNLVGDLTPISPGGSVSITRETMSLVEGREGMGGSISKEAMSLMEGRGGVLMSQSQTITKVVKRSVVTTVTNSGGEVKVNREDSNQQQKMESMFRRDGSAEDKKEEPIVTKDDSSEDEKEVVVDSKEEPVVIKDDSSSSEEEKEEVMVTKLSDYLAKEESNIPKDDSSSSEDEKTEVMVTKLSDYLATEDSPGEKKKEPLMTKDDSSDDEKDVVMVTKDDNNGGLKEEAIVIREDSQGDTKDDSSSSSSEDEEKVSIL